MTSRLILAIALVAALSGQAPGQASGQSDFAAELVSYSGPFGADPYDDPASVLGKPSVEVYDPGLPPFTPAGVFTPSLVYPAAFRDAAGGKLVTTLDVGAEIVVKFDHRVLDHPGNWYGMDFTVYGNSFFLGQGEDLTPDMDLAGYVLTGSVNAEPVTVSVSSDGVSWFTYADGPYADWLFPTNPFAWDRTGHDWSDEMDWTKPVAPSLGGADFAGISAADGIDLYDGSAGGTSFDLAALSPAEYAQLDSVTVSLSNGQLVDCKYIQYVKIVSGDPEAGEVDGFSDVAVDPSFDPGLLAGDLDGSGFVGQGDLDIVLDHWGQSVSPGDWLTGDPSGEGFVGQDDLDIVLDHWGQGTLSGRQYAVPAPGALALLMIAAPAVLLRRRGRGSRR